MERSITIGVLAERLAVPNHRIEYLIRARSIQPVARAGNLRVFDEKAVEILRGELKRSGRHE